jgi:hypothetical protein
MVHLGNANMLNPTPATNAKVCLASIARFSQRKDGVGMCCSTDILPRLRNVSKSFVQRCFFFLPTSLALALNLFSKSTQGAISNTPGQVFPAAASTISVSCSAI